MESWYNPAVEAMREDEFPHMKQALYLDHSGATIYAKSVVDRFAAKLTTGLYGNPHSGNAPAKQSGEMVDRVRLRTLAFLGADPAHYDVVFVANATAAIKLVAEAFRDLAERSRAGAFWYGYHRDSHTSLVGVRELAGADHHRCFAGDAEVERWLAGAAGGGGPRKHQLGLFAWPGQSNMTGRRLPRGWAGTLRRSRTLRDTYSLLDAAALAMTSPMDSTFAEVDNAPDFTCLSLHKIFGFPDLGALVTRKASGHILALRKYFGGGTVAMVSTVGDSSSPVFHQPKALLAPTYALHAGLEDGTLPFHSILALGEAIDVHRHLYGSMARVAQHTAYLTARLHRGIRRLRRAGGTRRLCRTYDAGGTDPGPVVAFNVRRDSHGGPGGGIRGRYVPYAEVEAAADAAGIYIRSGGVCNPGGIAAALGYAEPWISHRVRSAGHHCSGDARAVSLIHGRPTGIVRASLGPMSTRQDVDALLDFLARTYGAEGSSATATATATATASSSSSCSSSSSSPASFSTYTSASPSSSRPPSSAAPPSPSSAFSSWEGGEDGDDADDDDDDDDDQVGELTPPCLPRRHPTLVAGRDEGALPRRIRPGVAPL